GQGSLSAGPATCTAGPSGSTPGVGYWATDTNTLYVCNPTNVWTAYYTPYIYPFPLDANGFPNPSATTNPTPVPGDLNLDHIVNSLDYSIMNSHWFQNYASADIVVDGLVNTLDFAVLKSNWGRTW